MQYPSVIDVDKMLGFTFFLNFQMIGFAEI